MHRHLLFLGVVVAGFTGAVSVSRTCSADNAAAEEITICRDDFGIPNIFAKTEEGAVFGMGYAQAEDRLEELFKQYRRAEGTMAEVFGPQFLRDDYRQRLWRHRAVAEENYPKLPAKIRAICEAYQAGIKHYMKEHPAEVPAWATELHPWQIIALGRYIIWGWPEGDAGGDLRRGGIEPDPIAERGSNQWVITASRTADGYPLACIDPHLSWYGQFRFYEARLYGGELQMSGMAIPGLPISSLGHNRYCSIAMTTGGPDAADVYEEELNPANPRQYKYDGQWRDMTVRTEIIKVKEGEKTREQKFEIEYTHHGPVVAHKNGKGYAMKLPYFDQYRLIEQGYRTATARNLTEIKNALSMLQLMEQNVMVATVDGDIFYVRNGRVPIRPAGFDWKRPVPGNTSKSEWLGFHKLEDLVHAENPWQGYMQNCNVSPEHMTKFCPMTPERYKERPYLYNADNPLHQRAAMCLEELHANTRVTVRDAKDIALSTGVYNADVWQARLAAAFAKAGPKLDDLWQRTHALEQKNGALVHVFDEKTKAELNLAKFADLILRWNRRADADSTGAVAYLYWKRQLGPQVLQADRAGVKPPENITDEQMVSAVKAGMDQLYKDFSRFEVKYGDVFRVGREGTGRTWPVGGGSVPGLATPRAISFDAVGGGKNMIGHGGQTSTQVVQLSKPPKSWTLLPLGESDHRDSKHFDDQAEQLFSPGKLKPTYFMDKDELMKHVESKKVLQRPLQ
jgi:acyl-homoserine-lactone acylase